MSKSTENKTELLRSKASGSVYSRSKDRGKDSAGSEVSGTERKKAELLKPRKIDTSCSARVLRYLKKNGVREAAAHAVEKVRDRRFDYSRWIRMQEISPATANAQKNTEMRLMPTIYVLVTPADADAETRFRTIRSIRESTYRKVEIARSITPKMSDSDYIAIVREGDLVAKHAFFEAVSCLQDGADVIYTDEDTLCADGTSFCDPHFKPDYNPDYLRSINYIGHLILVRVGTIRSCCRDEKDPMKVPRVSALRTEADYYDFVLRCAERAAGRGGVKHIPSVLYHAAACSTDAKSLKDTADRADQTAVTAAGTEQMKKVLAADLLRRGMTGTVEDGPCPGSFHILYDRTCDPLVSIVIPNRDSSAVLEACIRSIRELSTYRNYEIIVVENNSEKPETMDYYRELKKCEDVRIIRFKHRFNFSRIVNAGVKAASGKYVILMNNDVTVKTPDWIERMLSQCERNGIGAVGPKLYYPNGTVQSAGIVVGLMGFAGSMMVQEAADAAGGMMRAVVAQDMSAVTAACMMVRRSVFQKIGGFPADLAVALNDVDFCLKLVSAGYRIVFDPTVEMIHHESLTRGLENTKRKKKRFAAEQEIFRKRWAAFLKAGDPMYNPNLSRRRCDWSQQT